MEKSDISPPPVSGLTMNMCAVAALAFIGSGAATPPHSHGILSEDTTMRRHRFPLFSMAATIAALAACDTATPVRPIDVNGGALAKGSSNPSATWKLPLADVGLSIKSDGQYSDGTYSVYANGVCSFSSTIFYDGTGDNTFGFEYPHGRSCGRAWTVTYPDGVSETLAHEPLGEVDDPHVPTGLPTGLGSMALTGIRPSWRAGSVGHACRTSPTP